MLAEPPDVQALLESLVTGGTIPKVCQILEACSTSTVQPILARDRWDDLSERDFLAISPALVLASNLLTCDRSVHFWHAVSWGNHEPRADNVMLQRVQINPVHDTSIPLPAFEKGRALEFLNELSLAVRLHFGERVDHEPQGECFCGASLRQIPEFSDAPRHRRRSTTTIATKALDRLKNRIAMPLGNVDASLRDWFNMAVTFVHEIAHAASCAIRGDMPEAFFGDQTFREMGFAITKWLFDGDPSIRRLKTGEEIMAIQPIPDPYMVKKYREEPRPFPLLESLTSRSELMGVISDDFVRAMHLRRTWEIDVPASGCRLLAPPVRACTCDRCAALAVMQESADLTSQPVARPKANVRVGVRDPSPRAGEVRHNATRAEDLGGERVEMEEWMLSLGYLDIEDLGDVEMIEMARRVRDGNERRYTGCTALE
ncbi:hypothetical protein CLAFUW4_00209 [Fulvia fulva]|uniref:Uncharacterized protein n=1 Tax=Passalora fulva TaxID=5499 RepID=A0A9Q8L8T8_PASFU|nr:uncharacterized protein CLAFUR5_00209 [Fulvia fulva]KAK4634374.1 hypothetical protein CLAFUR4_00209 [Fulvia fulva]KAK4638166.1 hypothetical protein CLAFUR0_00210 [Fulvia fulva]UJO12912.1 hypothetical protein CLAFUR5_00209 [Fulvia fulva]WPV08393.1 hypothetical protein CLAFUW4_00209 [Fulvia fulva]WPV24427.1 hypothetical protein CLAFUW7_00212 [Fulvia fulva]